MSLHEVIIYGKDGCQWCSKALELPLNPLMNIKVEYKNISIDQSFKEELMLLNPSARTVPQIFIDGSLVGGFEEYKEYVIKNFS